MLVVAYLRVSLHRVGAIARLEPDMRSGRASSSASAAASSPAFMPRRRYAATAASAVVACPPRRRGQEAGDRIEFAAFKRALAPQKRIAPHAAAAGDFDEKIQIPLHQFHEGVVAAAIAESEIGIVGTVDYEKTTNMLTPALCLTEK